MELTINTNSVYDGTLNKVSAADNVTVELWIERKVNAILKQQYTAEIIDTVLKHNIEDLPLFEAAIAPVAETIKSRDEAILNAAITEEPIE